MTPAATSVAVVIPCFRHAHVLAAAIDSALRQSVPPKEVIVVDDGFDDKIAAVARDYRSVTLIRQENRGLAGARNAGARAVTSEKIIFLDADDQLLPDAVRFGLECFADHPEAGFVYGGFVVVEGKSQWPRFVRADSRADLIRCNWIACVNSVMFDGAKLLAEGGFDETLKMAEDWDAYLRLSRKHRFGAYDKPAALYFKHSANMSNDVSELMRWTNIVREKEKQRGLIGEELNAWEEGEQVWRSIYYPPRVSLLRRAVRYLKRRLGR